MTERKTTAKTHGRGEDLDWNLRVTEREARRENSAVLMVATG